MTWRGRFSPIKAAFSCVFTHALLQNFVTVFKMGHIFFSSPSGWHGKFNASTFSGFDHMTLAMCTHGHFDVNFCQWQGAVLHKISVPFDGWKCILLHSYPTNILIWIPRLDECSTWNIHFKFKSNIWDVLGHPCRPPAHLSRLKRAQGDQFPPGPSIIMSTRPTSRKPLSSNEMCRNRRTHLAMLKVINMFRGRWLTLN